MKTDKLNEILSKEEYRRKRTAQQLNKWVEVMDSLLRGIGKRKRFEILERGIGKKFIKEVHPLKLFAQHYYKERDDVLFKPELKNLPFDAIILQGEEELYKVEITEAIDGRKWGLQKELLLEQGWAPVTGKIDAGNTRKHKRKKGDIKATSAAKESYDIFKETLMLIDRALKKKARKKYSNNTLLILVFDDQIGFNPDKNQEELKKFVQEKIHSFEFNFHKIFLVGWSGKLFYEFPIGSQSD